MRRYCSVAFSVVVLIVLQRGLLAEEPVFDAINYSSPESCLVVAESLGDRDAIKKRASALRAESDSKTLSNVLNWMQTLRYDANLAYSWRNFDSVANDRCYGGCADYAVACGALLQSAGIPTVWVKTMDVDWIREFKKNGPPKVWSGHVFLEVNLDGKWVLLDPGAAKIYGNYSTKSRILPGNRFAYHKGCDPKNMVMSLQWEPWKKQTERYFEAFDLGLLPVDESSAVSVRQRVHMIANDPWYQIFGDLIRRSGKTEGRSFNMDYDRLIPLSKGNTILVQTIDGKPIIDVATLRKHFPSVPPTETLTGKIVEQGTTLVFVDVSEFQKLLD